MSNHSQLNDTCVICLEVFDASNNTVVNNDIFMKNLLCNCKYGVHTSCFNCWIHSNNIPIYDGHRCLICSSPVELKKSCGEHCHDFIIKYCQLDRCFKYINVKCLMYAGFMALTIYCIVLGNKE